MINGRNPFGGSVLASLVGVAIVMGHASHAEADKPVDVTIEPKKGIGVGFDQILEEPQVLTINVHAPGEWYIRWSKRRYNAGDKLWNPDENKTRAKTHTYIVEGVIPEQGHAAAFEGELTKEGKGDDPPDFDVAVADLDIDLPGVEDEIEAAETGGLLLPPNAEVTLDVQLRAKWAKLKGAPDPVHLGQIEFTVTGTGAAEIEIYDPDGTKLYPVEGTSRPVQVPAEQKHYARQYTIKTIADFGGSATIEALFTWDGDIKASSDYTAKDVVRIDSCYRVEIDGEHSSFATKESPGTPVLLNDNWDNGKRYEQTIPDGPRECEPIWDLYYTESTVPNETDLMRVTLRVEGPIGLTGNAVLKLTSGDDRIRIWPRRTKGQEHEIITIPPEGLKIDVTEFPKDIYVEGIALGRAVMELEYQFPEASTPLTDRINIDVVTLVETTPGFSGPRRRVFYPYDSAITFSVDFGPDAGDIPDSYSYAWDLDGAAASHNPWEESAEPTVVASFGSAANGPNFVHLEPSAANRRKTYEASVKVSGGEDSPYLVLHRLVRVALATYEGTPVASSRVTGVEVTAGGTGYVTAPDVVIAHPDGIQAAATAFVQDGVVREIHVTNGGIGYSTAATTVALVGGGGSGAAAIAKVDCLRTQVAGLAALPEGFDDTPDGDANVEFSEAWFTQQYGLDPSPPGLSINEGNRLQYSLTGWDWYGKIAINKEGGAGRRVFACFIGIGATDEGFKLEDLAAIALHEGRHAQQHIDVRVGGTEWRAVDEYYGGEPVEYQRMLEADALSVDLAANASWRFLMLCNHFFLVYNGALADYDEMNPGSGKDAARLLLQATYMRIPFLEMKRDDYNWSVRAPK